MTETTGTSTKKPPVDLTQTSEEKKERVKAPFALGAWAEEKQADGEMVRAFILGDRQPPEDITTMAEVVAWAKREYSGDSCRLEFVRKMHGTLIITKKQVTNVEFKQ